MTEGERPVLTENRFARSFQEHLEIIGREAGQIAYAYNALSPDLQAAIDALVSTRPRRPWAPPPELVAAWNGRPLPAPTHHVHEPCDDRLPALHLGPDAHTVTAADYDDPDSMINAIDRVLDDYEGERS